MEHSTHGSSSEVARRWQLVFTTSQPGRTAAFWCQALGYIPQPPPDGFDTWDEYADEHGMALRQGIDIDAAIDPSGAGPRLLFVRDDATVRGQLSIEILTGTTANGPIRAELERTCAELHAAGAHMVSADWNDDDPWVQLRSPDDHPFRVL